jgi:tetratricopeptide (TPR) repeat protein
MTVSTALAPSEHERRTPTPVEESDNDTGVLNPVVLEAVMGDLCRFRDELGPDHIKVADTWNSLGLIRLHMQHNGPAAIKCHQEALKIYQKNGAPALLQSVTLSDLAGCYERTQEAEKALQLYQDANELLLVSETSPSHRVVQSIARAIARLKRE